jgi:ABC-2 type transport system ATP-binding protein
VREGNGPAAILEDVHRRLGAVEALRGISFEVPRGGIFGLLGANGAGKTTAIRILLGLLRPDRGRSSVLGIDSLRLPADTRRRVGYLSEEPFPYDGARIDGLLGYVEALADDWDAGYAAAIARRLEVPLAANLAELSEGQRRRAELLLALAPDPDLLVLDDPWLGVDALARRELIEVVRDAARERGSAVLFTSHVLSDAERLVDRVAVLREGSLVACESLAALKSRVRRAVRDVALGPLPDLPGELVRSQSNGVASVVAAGLDEPAESDLLARAPGSRVETLDLEEIFVALATSGRR